MQRALDRQVVLQLHRHLRQYVLRASDCGRRCGKLCQQQMGQQRQPGAARGKGMCVSAPLSLAAASR
jgi:hypothetical protein